MRKSTETGRARIRLIISGRVQGVGFRFSAYDEAKELALAGFVRNFQSCSKLSGERTEMAVPPEAAEQAAESHGSAGNGGGNGVAPKPHLSRDRVVIRFAGDSGDGMQLTGMQFTTESALAGNDIATLPDFPAEIRAPAGTLAGVSGFQLNFSSNEIFTAGDEPNVLVAMNPAALQANLEDVPPNAVIIVDREAFTDSNVKRAGYKTNPLTDHSLDKFQVIEVDVTKLTSLAVHGMGLNNRAVFR